MIGNPPAPRLGRRGFMLGSLGVMVAGRAPAASRASLQFTVLIDDQPLGALQVEIVRDGEVRVASIASEIEVRLLGLAAFRYAHASREIWRGDALQSFESATDDNGTAHRVHAQRVPEGLRVESADGIAMLPADAAPASYWNKAVLDRAIVFDPEQGRAAAQRVGPPRPLRVAAGAPEILEIDVEAEGLMRGVVWYAADARWLGGRVVVKDGRLVECRPS